MQKILVIQTAFIGDVVLATGLIEKLHQHFPQANIDILVRKGNESLLAAHPFIREVMVWNKKENKTKNLLSLLKTIRQKKYSKVINLQRFFSTGLITVLSGADETIGFDKNPLSFLYNKKAPHIISNKPPYVHEVERNHELIKSFTDPVAGKPKLYPNEEDINIISKYIQTPYITITPSSVWFTKQYPVQNWIEFIDNVPDAYPIYLLGGKDNLDECNYIKSSTTHKKAIVLAGELTFLQSTALMKYAAMNYVNDSAPLHFASSVNAPVTAVFCSTIPAFGFTPLSDKSYIVESLEKLTCRPCGLHGKKTCPLQHFKCGFEIKKEQLLQTLPS